MPEYVFRGSRRVATGEDEAEIAIALRQWHEALTGLDRDSDRVDVANGPGGFNATDSAQDAGGRDRDHHHASGSFFAVERREVFAERVPNDQLFQRSAGAESQHPGAQAVFIEGRRVPNLCLKSSAFWATVGHQPGLIESVVGGWRAWLDEPAPTALASGMDSK